MLKTYLNAPISLDKNREFNITSLYQWQTYRNLLCGFPTTESNKGHVEDALEYAKDVCFDSEKRIILVKPKEIPVILNEKLSYGEPAHIPMVTCVAEVYYCELLNTNVVDSISKVNARNMHTVDYISFTVGIVWFQDSFCLPIDKEVLTEFREIDWKKFNT